MTRFRMSRRSCAAVLALVLLLATPLVAFSRHQTFAGRHRIDPTPGTPAFVISLHGPINGRLHYSVTIGGNGAVSATGSTTLPSNGVHLSRDTLDGLLRLAEAERFFTMPPVINGGEPLPDAGSSSITIHTTSETRTVVEENPTRNARFDQLFAVLSAVVGVGR
jgi:hypothetical protein